MPTPAAAIRRKERLSFLSTARMDFLSVVGTVVRVTQTRRNLISTGLAAFSIFHVALSLVGTLAGFVVLSALISAKQSNGWTATFLVTTAATSVTGFFFPFHKFLPSHGVGIVSLLVLAVTIPALYVFHLTGPWRRTYVIGAVIALYLNVFVLIAQLFMKIPALKPLAPTQSEPPFLGTQAVVMLIFIVLGVLAIKRFPAEAVQLSSALKDCLHPPRRGLQQLVQFRSGQTVATAAGKPSSIPEGVAQFNSQRGAAK
jgi:hypothetical protein